MRDTSFKPPNLFGDAHAHAGIPTTPPGFTPIAARNNPFRAQGDGSPTIPGSFDRRSILVDDEDDLYAPEEPTRKSDMTQSAHKSAHNAEGGANSPAGQTADHPRTQESVEAQRENNDGRDLDLVGSIKGMYRILDSISEQGSGGLVDKVIISQGSVSRFINDLSPGAYKDLTKIDFISMDKVTVKPLGIYGSKSEIVRFLRSLEVIDKQTEKLLLASQESTAAFARPSLRPGLYALALPKKQSSQRRLIIIFWPEDSTWDDGAMSTVRRNRITFMRYLTKITDQIAVLISREHGQKLVWSDEEDKQASALGWEESERMFSFEVRKANEQEESVALREGFSLRHRRFADPDPPESIEVDLSQMRTRLVVGETRQGIMSVVYKPATDVTKRITEEFTVVRLRSILQADDVSVRLGAQVNDEAIARLAKHGLRSVYPSAFDTWERRQSAIANEMKKVKVSKEAQVKKGIKSESAKLEMSLESFVIGRILRHFPDLEEKRLKFTKDDSETVEDPEDYLRKLTSLHESIRRGLNERLPSDAFTVVESRAGPFTKLKNQIITFSRVSERYGLTFPEREELLNHIKAQDVRSATALLQRDMEDAQAPGMLSSIWGAAQSFVDYYAGVTAVDNPIREAQAFANHMSDREYISRLDAVVKNEPLIAPLAEESMRILYETFATSVKRFVKKLVPQVEFAEEKELSQLVQKELHFEEEKRRKESRAVLLDDLQKLYTPDDDCDHIAVIEHFEPMRAYGSYGDFRITADHRTKTGPRLQHTILPFHLTESDQHDMKMDSKFVPKPTVADERFAITFNLQLRFVISHIQLLESDRCLLILDSQNDPLFVYLEERTKLDAAIRESKHKKRILREKLGHDIFTAFDERKRLLVVCGVDFNKASIQLHSFVFDETYASLHGQGSTVNLRPWYSEIPTLSDIHFISGTDELALVERSGQVRVFSLVAQQFRPATLQLPEVPTRTFSTPDGSCFVVLIEGDETITLHAYHWNSFGSHGGFAFALPSTFGLEPSLTSISQRNNVHLITLDCREHSCSSVAIDITRQVTEFQFREQGTRRSAKAEKRTLHNSLIDCHAEVWTRFPVVPAVQRRTIVTSGDKQSKYLLFVAAESNAAFAPYFKELIQHFERSTKKPTETALSDIAVFSRNFASVLKGLSGTTAWQSVSSFRAGEWLVDIFCLIPIHIAIARDNRFIPLKDGVWAPDNEKALLGAEMGRIVDSLSFGWYESIFQSYMSTKPVKVVSSMGEQSVGKSFALNHLADTSFAGSAMRTTEGVWMSVAPTDRFLLVALDFEGVHSIERSAQEDTLLVLFNAAISNLVLFRNNFALSRDITNLFQSFQSSSSVLDPDANPTLFQSTLVVVIKDVVDSDRDEIAREFRLKLQSIVEKEQASNFITKLHRGHLKIIPWPVIESRQFYTLFHSLRRFLDGDSASHEAAGIFLHKLKMLMAKLKINDWGSLSQNMASHRAQHLMTLLPVALAYGATEVDPEVEPLKNFDTDLEIPSADTDAVFWLERLLRSGDFATKDQILSRLCKSWPEFAQRLTVPEALWTKRLQTHLDVLVTQRVEHVQAWVQSNLAKFGGSNAAMEELYRAMDTEVVEMKRALSLCKVQCAQCQLLCINPRFHDGDHSCTTDHMCKSSCQFLDAHLGVHEPCSLPAGHSGEHICDVMPHLCGHPCDLSNRRGCQGTCTKVASHEDAEHVCSARKHSCGMPCALISAPTSEGTTYTCPGICILSWDEEHDVHVCEASMSCPIACQLCKRLCSAPDHLHGLRENALHLCGQEHRCGALCAATGVCEIDTVPHSIEATFSGRHDRFQYTKYSQVTKRLPCVVPVAPGQLSHAGRHTHSLDNDVFHFCDVRCGSCGYLCTLRQGHPQAVHVTSHGSMSKTQWAIDGPDGTVYELDGHKFGTSDDGAPMMCHVVCQKAGRHLHIDYCRATDGNPCQEPETQHINERMQPNPGQPKDWITHHLYWRRLGFKDPYSNDEQSNFAKCDAMCPGPEHEAAPTRPAQPSYCSLAMFHPPQGRQGAPAGGYVSNDGHHFSCKNPTVMQQAFHVIFVIDRSGSMTSSDRRPLAGTPVTARISARANNRLGAVYSSLYSFWTARAAAINQGQNNTNRRDAYSAILFESSPVTVFSNDFHSNPNQLLERMLTYQASGGTNFDAALNATQGMMDRSWSTERVPVVIFLSDGECSVSDNVVYTLCRRAAALGKPLSFHSVSFGPDGSTTSLRRMADIALEVQNNAPPDPLMPANAIVESSFTVAIDTIRLAETFLGLAESLRKPRASLLRA